MGTRADFYVGRGKNAEWLGSIAWDGYPEGLPDHLKAQTSEANWRKAVESFFSKREDVSRPADGWPWPWENSHTTDYAYAFDNGAVYASNFGHSWFRATEEQPDEDTPKDTVFPNMKDRQRVTFGKRSGLIIMGG